MTGCCSNLMKIAKSSYCRYLNGTSKRDKVEPLAKSVELFGNGCCEVEFEVLFYKLASVRVSQRNIYSVRDEIVLERLAKRFVFDLECPVVSLQHITFKGL